MFFGSIPALVTPFKDGRVAEDTFRDLVEWQIDEGSTRLCRAAPPARRRLCPRMSIAGSLKLRLTWRGAGTRLSLAAGRTTLPMPLS